MTAYVLYQLEWILRLFVAAICGGLVGYERKVRLKTAGIRTHMLVAVGSALFMIISKYGFFDVINHADVSLDPSRIASQVVTGIGFIGAGAIITRNHKIDGLTTAAGLWATAAIGLAIGADMYVIGIAGTLCILVTQTIVRQIRAFKRYPNRSLLRLQVTFNGELASMDELPDRLRAIGSADIRMRIVAYKPDSFSLEVRVKLQHKMDPDEFIRQMSDLVDVRKIEVLD
ncbi:MgtC/SapB family protein [Lentilactobacillus buchneri]|uniref:Mg2+ transporter n=1 Tax=Lentilactobacillus buchneri subsp. silagei CD034 TaxID=1071400 RepID=J9WA01_LENBU|nr:MgtC/SapB family protein [Lentilactobacillus buchneri]MCC6101049.1 MgtC/SapB family protein [Lactobacillus sp.]AFS00906.1 Mg2+ transporter [Lentilactobacillus buchneri subsp. silagei CD034]MCT2899957.1 MgtC/SapB family protein [Lentilactobacillus buchneri]MCT3542365.1 MgtC/SapB family protein [Lentilactobacillus buchneri]MCT3545492.1 MgtC/SapB family protein [Lentilactobacillus buchneri]